MCYKNMPKSEHDVWSMTSWIHMEMMKSLMLVYDVQLVWCILTGEMGHPPRRKCDKIYKRNVSSFREFSFKKLSWVFPVNHPQQYKTNPPSPAVSLPFFKLNRPSDGSKLSQNRESWGKKLQKEPASQANPFNANNSGRRWSPSMDLLR